jgi:26S proteasome regulatory subunit N9
VLNSRRSILEDKIKIMAFSELVFGLPKNERVVSFARISETTGIRGELIELMIIKAMSLDLLRGSIDEVGWGLRQVGQTVSVSWIQPRVLNKERVGKMRQKFAEWQSGLDGLFHFVTEYNNSL